VVFAPVHPRDGRQYPESIEQGISGAL
jgi:hypothetical protein